MGGLVEGQMRPYPGSPWMVVSTPGMQDTDHPADDEADRNLISTSASPHAAQDTPILRKDLR